MWERPKFRNIQTQTIFLQCSKWEQHLAVAAILIAPIEEPDPTFSQLPV